MAQSIVPIRWLGCLYRGEGYIREARVREFTDALGRNKLFVGEIYSFSAPFWRVHYPRCPSTLSASLRGPLSMTKRGVCHLQLIKQSDPFIGDRLGDYHKIHPGACVMGRFTFESEP